MTVSKRAILSAFLISLALLNPACQGGDGLDPNPGVVANDVDLGPANNTVFGSRIDFRDRKRIFNALETDDVGKLEKWTNQYSFIHYEFTPTKAYEFNNRPQCKDFKLKIMMEYREDMASGTACRQDNGSWKIIRYKGM